MLWTQLSAAQKVLAVEYYVLLREKEEQASQQDPLDLDLLAAMDDRIAEIKASEPFNDAIPPPPPWW